MPKKLKLNLNDLKVQSFITALSDEEKNRLKGGGSGTPDCDITGTANTCGSCAATCIPICTNTGGGCTGNPICCN